MFAVVICVFMWSLMIRIKTHPVTTRSEETDQHAEPQSQPLQPTKLPHTWAQSEVLVQVLEDFFIRCLWRHSQLFVTRSQIVSIRDRDDQIRDFNPNHEEVLTLTERFKWLICDSANVCSGDRWTFVFSRLPSHFRQIKRYTADYWVHVRVKVLDDDCSL